MELGKTKVKKGRLNGIAGRRGYNLRKVMLIVDDQNSAILEKINEHREWGYQIIYVLTDSSTIKAQYKYRSRIYPLAANIRSLLRHDIVDEIVCCVSSLPDSYMHELALISIQFGVSLMMLPGSETSEMNNMHYRYIGHYAFKTFETTPRNNFAYGVKTFLEMAFAAIALLVLSPFLLIISLVIKLTSEGPVIFKQQRVGLRGRNFYIYKFRTMVTNAERLKAALMEYNESDGPAFKIRNDPRITPFGRFLRKTGIDEIPQLYNVMRGEMVLIGPRPMLPSEVSVYEEWQVKRMSVKPGITCSWQVHPNRNQVAFDHWMKLDRDYVENWSAKTDVKLFFRTIKSIFAARGL
jgi:exopolysaccharide biosynthesis polyprenyl glycosylphosphotransferase